MQSYPNINIGRELFHSASLSETRNDRTVMISVKESLIKKISRTFFEEGLIASLNAAMEPENQDGSPVIRSIARYMLYVVGIGTKVQYFFKPHLREQGADCLGKVSQTRDWARSSIRCIKWHPNCFKIAVAALDDSIRIYTDEPTIVPILKVRIIGPT